MNETTITYEELAAKTKHPRQALAESLRLLSECAQQAHQHSPSGEKSANAAMEFLSRLYIATNNRLC